jgi:hypothetical protein
MSYQKKPIFNTSHLLPATGYYNQLMREIDDAYWIGSGDVVHLEAQADDIKRNYIDKGEVWYPDF